MMISLSYKLELTKQRKHRPQMWPQYVKHITSEQHFCGLSARNQRDLGSNRW